MTNIANIPPKPDRNNGFLPNYINIYTHTYKHIDTSTLYKLQTFPICNIKIHTHTHTHTLINTLTHVQITWQLL